MEFEEFFKKKKIDLPVLEKAEPSLFSEFKTHYQQMGEKSFDHTKKYWFNKLRRQFPLSPEIKTEKAHIANPIAEQTVTESLIETVLPPPSPKVGFTPRFKAGATTKPAEITDDKKEELFPDADRHSPEITTPAPSPKAGFTPRFKAGVTAKPAVTGDDKKEESVSGADQKPSETTPPSPKVGFTPRFKAGVTSKPVKATDDKKEENTSIADQQVSEASAPAPSPKVGFTPRFKAGITKPAEVKDDEKEEALPPAVEESSNETPSEGNTESKPVAYKPRFKMKPKTDEE